MTIDAEKVVRARAALDHVWETAAIVCLADRPLRHGELSRAIREWSVEPLPEGGVVTRALRKLRTQGLVHQITDADGRVKWKLSNAGAKRLADIISIASAIPTP